MARRGNHEGSVRQLKDGRWEACVQFEGHRYWHSTDNQAAARRWVAETRQKHGIGQLVRPSKVTVADHLATWQAVAAADLRPKTQADYEYMVRCYLAPAFGRFRVQQLTPAIVARQFADWRTSHRASGKTLLNAHRALHRALVVAMQWGIIATNPLDAVEPPRSERPNIEIWGQDEAARFLGTIDAAKWDSVLFTLLIATGCRLGEILALRWEDYDRDAGTVSIHRNLVRIAGQFMEGEPKTRAGTRTLHLPAFAVEALRAWRVPQLEMRLEAGAAWQDTGRIVTLPIGTTPHQRTALNAFHRACRAAEITEVRLHDLRHLHASLLLAQGLPLPAVSARLGHASTAVTASIYSHALKGSDIVAAQAIETSLTRAAY